MSTRNKKTLTTSLQRAVRLFIAGASFRSQRTADALGLHPTDMQFINLLDLLGPMTPGALAQCSGLSSGGVTVVLDRLEAAGYLRREANPDDRRSVLVHLQPSRQKRVDANYKDVQKQFAEITAGFSEVELEVVLRFFTASSAKRPPILQGRPAKVSAGFFRASTRQ
ncbi:MAG TPA: MarR family transcriptional regulator [Acidobacteriaceae bacterium]|nr:MarR family transcriptional regulator [Acidobacteriaceae bacterium]